MGIVERLYHAIVAWKENGNLTPLKNLLSVLEVDFVVKEDCVVIKDNVEVVVCRNNFIPTLASVIAICVALIGSAFVVEIEPLMKNTIGGVKND